MKIAILSDFHLGYERFREDAFRQAEEALNRAAQLADMIIISGDIFDNRTPRPDVIAEAINLFRNLSGRKWGAQVTSFVGDGGIYTKVPIIAIPGTHERRAQDAADPVDILGLAGLVVDASNATVIVEAKGEKVAVRGIGGIADDRFKEVVMKENPAPVEGAFNIFMFHESLYELLPFNQDFMHVDELPKGFDLYVNGHIHNKVEASVHGKKLLIPGSTVLTQLKAGEQEPKGFFIFDTKSYTYEFARIKSRRFVLLNININEIKGSDVVEEVSNDIDAAIGSGNDLPIIRVVLQGEGQKAAGIELGLNDLPRRYKDAAIIEVSKSGVSKASVKSSAESEAIIFERMSVRDYGIGVFMEKIKAAGVDFGISPVEMLDMLSLDASKEKIVNEALSKLMD